MKQQPAISVLVPVYNTAGYIRKCFASLSNCPLRNIEFIVVDDGSYDESPDICDEYAKKDPRFKVIHQANGGLAIARQNGLDIASGEYVIVCDSDDWIESDIYTKLYNAATENDADIAVCGYFLEYDNGRSIPYQYIFKESDGAVDNYDFLAHGAGSSWIKLIRKSLFERTNASYEPGINMSEDSLIIYKLLKGNPKIVQIRENLYHYRRQFGGESYTNNIKMTHIYQLSYTYEWLKNNYTEPRYASLIFQRAIDLAFACLRTKDLKYEYLRDFLRNELLWKSFASNRITAKRLFIAIVKALPISLSKLLLAKLYRFIYK